MGEPDEIPRRYRWPWFVLAAVLLFILLAIVFVSFKARQIEQQRNFNAPLPSSPAN